MIIKIKERERGLLTPIGTWHRPQVMGLTSWPALPRPRRRTRLVWILREDSRDGACICMYGVWEEAIKYPKFELGTKLFKRDCFEGLTRFTLYYYGSSFCIPSRSIWGLHQFLGKRIRVTHLSFEFRPTYFLNTILLHVVIFQRITWWKNDYLYYFIALDGV